MVRLDGIRRKDHREILLPFARHVDSVAIFGKEIDDDFEGTFTVKFVRAHGDVDLPFATSLLEAFVDQKQMSVFSMLRYASLSVWEAPLLQELYVRRGSLVELKMWVPKTPVLPEGAHLKLVGTWTHID